MIRPSRPPRSESRHRGARRSVWARLVAPGHRAGAFAVGGTLVLVGLFVVVGLAGGAGRFTPLPLPQAGDSGAGTQGTPTAGQRTSPPDPRTSVASRPQTGDPTSSTSPVTAVAQSASPASPGSQQPAPSSPPSNLDTSVKRPQHHGKPPLSGEGPRDNQP